MSSRWRGVAYCSAEAPEGRNGAAHASARYRYAGGNAERKEG